MTEESKQVMFRNRLVKVYRHLHKLARKQGISCFRLYDRDLPEFPLIIEVYDQYVYVAEYRSKHSLSEEEYDRWLDECLQSVSDVLQVPADHIFVKQRQRKAGREGQYQKFGSDQHITVVKENGLSFRINLSDYLDTGLFLDHRLTRKLVMDQSPGKRVLNLFCYTGSFSVYAAAGGAIEVRSVDLSNTYLQWAKENFELNHLKGEGFHFIRADVKQYLDELPAEYFDLVVMDPPTFSNSKMMKDFLDIQRDHVELLDKVLAATKPGGKIYFSTNMRKFELQAEDIKAASIKDITRATTPFDFQGKLQRWCFEIIR